jgi:hypothetical protein
MAAWLLTLFQQEIGSHAVESIPPDWRRAHWRVSPGSGR